MEYNDDIIYNLLLQSNDLKTMCHLNHYTYNLCHNDFFWEQKYKYDRLRYHKVPNQLADYYTKLNLSFKSQFDFFKFILDEAGYLELRFLTFYYPDMNTLKRIINEYPFINQTHINDYLNNTVLNNNLEYNQIPKDEEIVLTLYYDSNQYYIYFILDNTTTQQEQLLGNTIVITNELNKFLTWLVDKTSDFFYQGLYIKRKYKDLVKIWEKYFNNI